MLPSKIIIQDGTKCSETLWLSKRCTLNSTTGSNTTFCNVIESIMPFGSSSLRPSAIFTASVNNCLSKTKNFRNCSIYRVLLTTKKIASKRLPCFHAILFCLRLKVAYNVLGRNVNGNASTTNAHYCAVNHAIDLLATNPAIRLVTRLRIISFLLKPHVCVSVQSSWCVCCKSVFCCIAAGTALFVSKH